MRWMERYPDAVCSLTHGFPWRTFLNDEQEAIALPDEIWEPFSNPNVSIEVCFPVRLGDIFEYPYREVWPTLREMVERIGPANLMWGTDMPFQNRFLHVPPVPPVDRGTVRRLGRPERRRPVDDDGRDGRAGSGRE